MSSAWIDAIQAQCKAKKDFQKTGQHYSLFLTKDTLISAVQILDQQNFFIEDVTALDVQEGFLVVYHFDHFESPERVTLRVLIPHSSPKIPSIAAIYPGAEWHERETFDFFGIKFMGNPNLIPLLLPAEVGTEPPLVKERKKQKALKDLMGLGEVISCDDGFDLAQPGELSAEEESAESKK